MKNLFILHYSHYEDYIPYYFEGPEDMTQKEFERLCNDLLGLAAFNAVEKEKKEDYPSWVGWHDIVIALGDILETQGFRKLNGIKTAGFFGSGIIEVDRYGEAHKEDIKLGDMLNHVTSYNDKIRAKMDERFEKKEKAKEKK